jgi:hypothetical protein
MSDDDEWDDPRMKERVEPKVDDLYGDSRYENDDGTFDEKYRIVYCDDEVVLLRSNNHVNRSSGYNSKHYRMEKRDRFEKEAGSGRYKKVSESSDAPPKTDEIQYHIGVVKRLIAHYAETPGRIADHKEEVLQELLSMLKEFDAEEVDWTEVDTIGQQAADNLKDSGFVTDEDVRVADKEELLGIDYVGESGVENLKEYVSE